MIVWVGEGSLCGVERERVQPYVGGGPGEDEYDRGEEVLSREHVEEGEALLVRPGRHRLDVVLHEK